MNLSLKLLFATLTFAVTTFIAVPALATDESSLDTTYRQQSQRLQTQVKLSREQSRDISTLFETRKESERHLRRQMLTTFTPEQREHAKQLWEQRDRGQTFTLAQRRALRTKVGITPAQEQQFFAYEKKLQTHRALTTYLAGQILTPEQRKLTKDFAFNL